MFCPQCKAEYRPGFTRCSDCGLDLVNDLPDANIAGTDEDFREVWAGDNQDRCVFFCLALKEAGISYHVDQNRKAVLNSDNTGKFTISVPSQSYDEAKKVIDGDVFSDSDVELPAQDDRPPTDVDDEHRDWKNESPDDATVEVATETTRDAADLLVLALRENDIQSRIAIQPDGSRKIFVTLQNAARSHEIVGEVQSGDPPESCL
jgi:hypothetical protein